MKLKLILLLFFLGTALLAQVNVKIETVFTLNDAKTGQKEYMFKQPGEVVADDECNFYINDYFGTEIRKYSKEGKYLKTIGRAGAGPGELKFVGEMYFNNMGEIVIHDPPNYRITYFNKEGKYLRSEPIREDLRYLSDVSVFNNTSLIGVKPVNGYPMKHGNKFYVYDNDLKNAQTSFGHSSIFWKYDDAFEKHMNIGRAFQYTAADEKVFVAKKYYDGKIFIFDKVRNWELKIIEGRPVKKPYYEIYEEWISLEGNPAHEGWQLGFGEKWKGSHKVFTVCYKSSSVGLILYKNQYIINFLALWMKGDQYEFGVDIFKKDGSYVGYSRIETGKKNDCPYRVFAPDKEGNLFMIKVGGVISKIKLSVN